MTNINKPVLGQTVREFPGTLDTIPIPPGTQSITYTSDEVSGVCPVTKQPDMYIVEIVVQPLLKGIESKSLKLFLNTFREKGIFAEDLAQQIAERVMIDLNATCVEVTTIQKPRGGISIETLVRLPYKKKE